VVPDDPGPRLSGVEGYYDRNTRWFLGIGGAHAATGAIHRGLWGPGVTTARAALEHANDLVSAEIGDLREPRLLDLGCGVGGTLRWLVARHGGSGVGVTLSAEQVRLARELTPDPRCTFVQADFADLPPLPEADVAWAIEAFVHGPDPEGFFRSAGRAIRPGGRLVLIDDFRAPEVPPEAERRLAEYRDGWLTHGLCTPAEAVARAAPWFTLAADRDLTPLIHLWRPRDRLVALAVGLLGPKISSGPYWSSLVGGNALQYCLDRRWITYRELVFTRAAT
jgi:SAM-dependent methyltransferase